MLAVTQDDLAAVIWDFEQPVQAVSDRPFYTKVIAAHPAAPIQLQAMHLTPDADYHLQIYRTGYHANDAYSAYLEMGAPKDLTAEQLAHLTALTRDSPETDRIVREPCGGVAVAVPTAMTSCW